MNLTVDQLRALRPSLTFDGVMPPKAAVCALIALSGPIASEDVIVSETSSLGENETGVAWALAARTAGGLAVVTVAASAPWDWSRGGDDKPHDAAMHARWVPLRAVQSIAVSEPRMYNEYDLSGSDLSFSIDWSLGLEGTDPVVFTPDSGYIMREHHQQFFERLRDGTGSDTGANTRRAGATPRT